ncbi:MAG: hypothetical protein ACTJLL_01005 [Anaplasma sp.]
MNSLMARGIPVMVHAKLMPQCFKQLGNRSGKADSSRVGIMEDVKAVY